MKIVVTGAAGFIGSHVVDHLLEQGHTIEGLDNFNSFYEPRIKRQNLASASRHPHFRLIEMDFRHVEPLQQLFSDFRPDLVIHLGAMAGVRPSIENPALYYSVNVEGTLQILEACRIAGTRHVIFASSSSVYGANNKVPFSETDPVEHPISPYAASKRAGELLCYTYHHLHQFSFACLRFFTVYGPRQRPDLAIHKFARLMTLGENIPVFGDGSTRRDYTYIDDIVQGVAGAMTWLFAAERPQYEVFNLGESQTISLRELICQLEQSMDLRARIEALPEQPGDVPVTYADISKARHLLHYAPAVSLQVGIPRFIEWLR